MYSVTGFLRSAAALIVVAAGFGAAPASADDGFPFGSDMTLDVARQPGSKRLPTLEIGDNGEARLELWCKGGKGQFSVAGNTVIFVAGQLEAAVNVAGGTNQAFLGCCVQAGSVKKQIVANSQ